MNAKEGQKRAGICLRPERYGAISRIFNRSLYPALGRGDSIQSRRVGPGWSGFVRVGTAWYGLVRLPEEKNLKTTSWPRSSALFPSCFTPP